MFTSHKKTTVECLPFIEIPIIFTNFHEKTPSLINKWEKNKNKLTAHTTVEFTIGRNLSSRSFFEVFVFAFHVIVVKIKTKWKTRVTYLSNQKDIAIIS